MAVRKSYEIYNNDEDGIIGNVVLQDPSDISVDDPGRPIMSGIYVGTAGNVALVMAGNENSVPIVFKNVPAGKVLFGRFLRVAKTGTTASNILGLFSSDANAQPFTSHFDEWWPSLAFAFAGLSSFDDWSGTYNPGNTSVTELLTVSANENADKGGILWPGNSPSDPARNYRGAMDASAGTATQGNASNTQLTLSALTYAAGDWFSIAVTGTRNFDGSAGAVTKTVGEFWLYNGATWSVQASCPHFDVPNSNAVWDASDNNTNKMRAISLDYHGHALHYCGWWHKGGAYWLNHSLWNVNSEAQAKDLISKYIHRHAAMVKAHFEGLAIALVNMDGINEAFDEDITTSTSVKEPGIRGWNRTYPAYTIEESPWHYAATKITSWGSNNIERIKTLWQYTFQVLNKYFPGVRIGFNDFGWEQRRYTTNTLQVSSTDVNGNTANKTVWLGHQQGQKQIAVDYWLSQLMQWNVGTPIIADATLDAGAEYIPPRGMGMQYHVEPKNAFNLEDTAYLLCRLSHLNTDDFELYISEANHRGEHVLTQNPASVTILAGAAGATIDTVRACFPTTQTALFVELISAPVAWTTSDANTATLLAAAINTGSGTHGYSAIVDATTNTKVNIWIPANIANSKGFDLTSTKTGTITITLANSRVNEPTLCPPQFRIYRQVSQLSNQRTSWTFGWTDANKKYWEYGTWCTESFFRMFLRNSKIRLFKWWTPDGGVSGNPISIYNYDYTKSTSFTMMQRLKSSADWKAPSARVIPNRGRINFQWYKHLILTQTNVTVDGSGTGSTISSASGANTMPWSHWNLQGISADNFVAVLNWTAPANPAANVLLFCSYINSTNRVEVYFSSAAGAIKIRSIVAGATIYDVAIGTVTASSANVIAIKVTPTGASVSLNGAALVTASGAPPVGTTISIGFDHAGANGYNSAKLLSLDLWHPDSVSSVQALSTLLKVSNPWPLWDGSTAYPALITENS